MGSVERAPWLGVELRHLAALSAVAREGSFRGAADSLGYVQSAISQQLGYLERLVGARLVDRRRGIAPVRMTEAGELLLHHVDEILARFVAAQADVEALRDGRAGRLRIGVRESTAFRLMPRILASFAARIPGVEVEIQEGRDVDDVAARVQRGDLDLAFGALPLPPGPFEVADLVRDTYVLLVPAGWPIAERMQVPSVAELVALPLIGQGWDGTADGVDAQLRAHGIEPRYAFRSDTSASVQALVAAEIGAAIVPRLAVDVTDERTISFALDELLAQRHLALYWHRERVLAPAVRTFVKVAAAVCAEAGAETGGLQVAA